MFGDNLRMLREEKGISQAELARRIGVSWSVISNYEAGKRSQISKPYISAIANALGVDESELIAGTITPVDLGDGIPTAFCNPPLGDAWHVKTNDEIQKNRTELCSLFDSLTIEGQFAATDMIRVLTAIHNLQQKKQDNT